MTQEALLQQIKIKQSYLCVGLDIDLEKIPDVVKQLMIQFLILPNP